jgi:hypothetical protein
MRLMRKSQFNPGKPREFDNGLALRNGAASAESFNYVISIT